MRTIIRPAAVTRTETSDAGTTARGMKTSPHLWTRPSVRSAPPTVIVARPVPAHHSPISCPSCRNSSLIPGGIPSAHAQRVAALYNVEWTRRHMDEARVLLFYRREDLAERWPEELAALNTDVEKAVRDHALRRYGEGGSAEAVRRVVFALVDVPYAAGRRHLISGEPPPSLVDELFTETVRRVLSDRPEA